MCINKHATNRESQLIKGRLYTYGAESQLHLRLTTTPLRWPIVLPGRSARLGITMDTFTVTIPVRYLNNLECARQSRDYN